MRISDWSSDVCSSDLEQVACDELFGHRPSALDFSTRRPDADGHADWARDISAAENGAAAHRCRPYIRHNPWGVNLFPGSQHTEEADTWIIHLHLAYPLRRDRPVPNKLCRGLRRLTWTKTIYAVRSE